MRANLVEISSHTTGCWVGILISLGVAPEYLRNKHQPCPSCGGTDRFRFDDKEGKGTFYCGGGGDPVNGDGFELLKHVYGWDFKDAAQEVRKVLGIEPGEMRELPPKVTPITKPVESNTQSYAHKLWEAAEDDDSHVAAHPYCQRKGIAGAYGAARGRVTGKLVGRDSDCVIVPQRTLQGGLIGVECINSEGVKQTFGNKGILTLGNTLDRSLKIYVVEGWADGIATWKYFGNVVVIIVFGIGRQQKLAEQIHKARPEREIIIVRDAA